jgi:hypothetical protein
MLDYKIAKKFKNSNTNKYKGEENEKLQDHHSAFDDYLRYGGSLLV